MFFFFFFVNKIAILLFTIAIRAVTQEYETRDSTFSNRTICFFSFTTKRTPINILTLFRDTPSGHYMVYVLYILTVVYSLENIRNIIIDVNRDVWNNVRFKRATKGFRVKKSLARGRIIRIPTQNRKKRLIFFGFSITNLIQIWYPFNTVQ